MKTHVCTTCDRTLPLAQFAKAPEGSTCTHGRDTCKRCWRRWLKAQVASKPFDQISCAQCSNVLGQSEMRARATKHVYNKYLDAELKATMSADPQFRWCIAAGCKSGQIHTEGDIFRCVTCSHRYCVNCNIRWHEEETCAAYQARITAQPNEEMESAKTLDKVSKLCPGCHRKVQKISGCDHMTCSMCRHEYCWLCLASYDRIRKEGNTAHKKDCKYHSSRLLN